MTEKTLMRCADCRFWQPDPAGTAGQCRRYPPVMVVITNHDGSSYGDTRWPETYKDEWCGEFLALGYLRD